MSIPRFPKRHIVLAVVLGIIVPPVVASSPEKPLKANFVTQELLGFKPGCPSKFGGTTTGKGTSTHLGKLSLNGGDCITPVEDHYKFEGKMTLTAANGDKLTGDYVGLFTPSGKGSMYNLTGAKLHITGGTGRFSKASGTADLTGDQDILTGKGKIEANGTVKY